MGGVCWCWCAVHRSHLHVQRTKCNDWQQAVKRATHIVQRIKSNYRADDEDDDDDDDDDEPRECSHMWKITYARDRRKLWKGGLYRHLDDSSASTLYCSLTCSRQQCLFAKFITRESGIVPPLWAHYYRRETTYYLPSFLEMSYRRRDFMDLLQVECPQQGLVTVALKNHSTFQIDRILNCWCTHWWTFKELRILNRLSQQKSISRRVICRC